MTKLKHRVLSLASSNYFIMAIIIINVSIYEQSISECVRIYMVSCLSTLEPVGPSSTIHQGCDLEDDNSIYLIVLLR